MQTINLHMFTYADKVMLLAIEMKANLQRVRGRMRASYLPTYPFTTNKTFRLILSEALFIRMR